VQPYYFTFTTFTKGRWVGETILEVFTREFRAQPKQEYVSRVQGSEQSGKCEFRAQAKQEFMSPGPRPIRNM
jgi:hypothetical protein